LRVSGEGVFAAMRGANEEKTNRARALRHNSTRAELVLWNKLRARQLGGFKFVRQEPIGRYVVDFLCRERRLVVEVDGGQHAVSRTDPLRDQWLRNHNYRVLRFWNNDVLSNTGGVLETILSALHAGTPPHPDLAEGEVRPLPASGER
jgi:very-short-patch-repair endonuclease